MSEPQNEQEFGEMVDAIVQPILEQLTGQNITVGIAALNIATVNVLRDCPNAQFAGELRDGFIGILANIELEDTEEESESESE